jgi:hypothetical protein
MKDGLGHEVDRGNARWVFSESKLSVKYFASGSNEARETDLAI